MKTLITNALLKSLKPEAKRYEVRDTRIPGFLVRVNPTGKLVYVMEIKRGHKVTLGRSEHLSLNQARDKAKSLMHSKLVKPKTRLTFSDYIETEYAPWRCAHRKNGRYDIDRLMTNFADLLGNTPLHQIDRKRVDDWRTQRINSGTHAATVNRDMNVLKASLSKAVEWGFLNEHPLAGIRPLKFDDTPHVRYLDEAEQKRLQKVVRRLPVLHYATEHGSIKDQVPDYLQPMIILSLYTGARRGELFSLTWENINVDRKTIGLIGKSQSLRQVPLHPKALEALLAWRETHHASRLVFTNENGEAIKTVRRAWLKVLKASDIQQFRWHDMRHHFASMLVMKGVDLNTVRELLGHSNLTMTLKYAHLAPEHKAAAVEKL